MWGSLRGIGILHISSSVCIDLFSFAVNLTAIQDLSFRPTFGPGCDNTGMSTLWISLLSNKGSLS